MTNTSFRQKGRMMRTAGWVAFAIAVIVTLQGVFILFNGFDQSRLEEKANVEWAELERAFPTLTDYLSVGQTDRTLAITVIAVGLQASLLIWFALRKGQRVAPAVLWVLPAMLLGWSIHFLINDDTQIGTPNLVFAVLTAVAIVVAGSELTG
jgi:hypothetical protein